MLSRPLAAGLSIEFLGTDIKKILALDETDSRHLRFLKQMHLSKKSETFRDGSDGHSGHLITWTRARHLGVSRYGTLDQK